MLAAYVHNEHSLTGRRLRFELAAQTARCLVHPVYFGSAVTGEGVDAVRAGLAELLPGQVGDVAAPLSARVFKIDRGPAGERIAYVRMFAGTAAVRQPLQVGDGSDSNGAGVHGTSDSDGARGREIKATAISVASAGGWVRRPRLSAGEIGKLWGLGTVRIGDTIGRSPDDAGPHHFAPPTMETVIAPARPGDDTALRAALALLAEQDPLINVRVDETGREVAVSLYGEVQKEVIGATLADEFGIDVTFRETTTICVERPAGRGEAVEVLNTPANPFQATIGLRVEPGRPGSGIVFRMPVPTQSIPLYVYKSAEGFAGAMAGYVRHTLREGRFGWPVTDCVVTMTSSGYSVADGPPSRRGPDSTSADFRYLTPMVLMQALDRAGTVVCEPVLSIRIEAPAWAVSALATALGRLGAAVRDQSVRGDLTTLEAGLPAARTQDLQRQLPALTAGEGVVESTFDGYRPVHGEPPVRRRTTADPLHREVYLTSIRRRR